jgi:opacity protein-like surface antigen
MKKIILSALALAAFTISNAQEAKFGIKAGVDFAYQKYKLDTGFGTLEDSESETGFFIGGLIDVAISEKFHIQPELLYTKVDDLDFIHIPITAKFQVAPKFDLLAGPTLSFLLDSGEGAKSVNYGLDLGAAFNIDSNFTVDAKYNLGLANLLENGNGDNYLRLGGFYLGLAYKF